MDLSTNVSLGSAGLDAFEGVVAAVLKHGLQGHLLKC